MILKSMKKSYLIIAVLFAAALGASVFVWQNQASRLVVQEQSEEEIGASVDEQKQFVLDIDPNTDLWKTQETEFFTIKFPKEWYWIESESSGYRSLIITNNHDLNITKEYPDIVIYGKGIPGRDDRELMVTFRGGLTQEIDDKTVEAEKIINQRGTEISDLMRNNYGLECSKNFDPSRLILECDYLSEGQMVQNYYVINRRMTLSVAVRKNSINFDEDDTIKKIIRTIQLKEK